MEHTKIEIEAVETTIAEATDCRLRELSDLQLAFIGGGMGEVVFA
jgi:hypothetical protein